MTDAEEALIETALKCVAPMMATENAAYQDRYWPLRDAVARLMEERCSADAVTEYRESLRAQMVASKAHHATAERLRLPPNVVERVYQELAKELGGKDAEP